MENPSTPVEVRRTSIIWNVTSLCPWDCTFCVVNAKKVRGMQQVNHERSHDYAYEDELNFRQKLKVIDDLDPGRFRIDFSGGEPLIDPLNVQLLLHASQRLGPENVGLSTSGAMLTDSVIEALDGKINDVELTMDHVPFRGYHLRPVGYHEYASHAVAELGKRNISVGVQTVLTKANIDRRGLANLYEWIRKHGVNTWSLLRFFPSGRGANLGQYEPTAQEYGEVIEYLKELTRQRDVEVQFQYLFPNHARHSYDCRAVKRSIGILPNGQVVACFWALDAKFRPLADQFILGSVPQQSMSSILSGPKARYWTGGHHTCKLLGTDGQMMADQQETHDVLAAKGM